MKNIQRICALLERAAEARNAGGELVVEASVRMVKV